MKKRMMFLTTPSKFFDAHVSFCLNLYPEEKGASKSYRGIEVYIHSHQHFLWSLTRTICGAHPFFSAPTELLFVGTWPAQVEQSNYYQEIFRLEPRLKADPFGETEGSEGLPQESIAANKVDRRMSDLTSLYGTKKAKDKDNKWKSLNEQRNDAAVNEHPESINANVEGKEVLEDAVESTYRNIPPYDPNADTPEKVYYLDEIIPKGERAYLLDILEDLRSGIDISTKCYPSFVYNRVHQLRKIQNQEEKETFACILSYISHLLNFWERHAHRRSKYDAHDKSTDNVKIPRIVYQKLLRTFLDSELNVLSTEKNNLLIGYILVLTLFADSFKTDPTDIARDLKMTIQSVKLYYQQLGCKTSRESASSPVLITLGIPLEFTYPERTKRRK